MSSQPLRLRTSLALLVLFATGLACTSSAMAQRIIRLRVLDANVPIKNASVVISSTGFSEEATTNGDGVVALSLPLQGEFDVKISVRLPGYSAASATAHVKVSGKRIFVNGIDAEKSIPDIELSTFSREYPDTAAKLQMLHYLGGSVWNTWVEAEAPEINFEPVQKLLVRRRYQVVVDLGALAYSEEEGVYHTPASDTLRKWLAASVGSSVGLTLLIIPDEKFFAPQADGEGVKQLAVNLRLLRKVQTEGLSLDRPPLDELRTTPNSGISYGRVKFTVETTSAVGKGAIAFSVWANSEGGKEAAMFPIDEFTIPVCIVALSDSPCASAPEDGLTDLRGVQLSALNSSGKAQPLPDAALQFVELEDKAVYGVFHCNTCQRSSPYEFSTWRLGESVDQLVDYLTNTLNQSFQDAAAARDSVQFRETGEALYRELFSNPTGKASPAEQRFLAFVRERATSARPTSIFVRMLQNRGVQLSLVPLGLMSVPGKGPTAGFIGLKFIIDSPLEVQTYSSGTACIARWTLLVPPTDIQDGDMADARLAFSPWLNAFLRRPAPVNVFDNITLFGQWLGASPPSGTDPPSVLVVVSHHDSNRLYFDSLRKVPSILSANVGRQFASPSVAIVDACGTSAPGAYDFVRRLNEHGI